VAGHPVSGGATSASFVSFISFVSFDWPGSDIFSGLAVFMLMYVSQARSSVHREPNPPLNWPDNQAKPS